MVFSDFKGLFLFNVLKFNYCNTFPQYLVCFINLKLFTLAEDNFLICTIYSYCFIKYYRKDLL